MVKLMVDFTKQYDGGYLEPYVAEKLLDFLESKGMLPPHNNYTGRIHIESYSILSNFIWEPEND